MPWGDALSSLATKEKVKSINEEQIFISFSVNINTYLGHRNSISCFTNEMLSILKADDKVPMTGIMKMNQRFVLITPSKCYMKTPSPTLSAVTFIYSRVFHF